MKLPLAILTSPTPHPHRSLPTTVTCSDSINNCLGDNACGTCLNQLDEAGIDWFVSTDGMTCEELTTYLEEANFCGSLTQNNLPSQGAKSLFCSILSTCEDGGMEDDEYYEPNTKVDCSTLTSCEWPNMYASFLGDGVCDQDLPGCYNTAICGFDSGDCCEDKCTNGAWTECGSSGFSCIDPTSLHCDASFLEDAPENYCPNAAPAPAPAVMPTCATGESLYKVSLHDSWGDGWNEAALYLRDNSNHLLLTATLPTGSEGESFVCLTSQCFSIEVAAGEWGNECSWDVKLASGGNALASGGAPNNCEFPVGGNYCANTCTGEVVPDQPIFGNDDSPDDPDQGEVVACITTSCVIQISSCAADFMNCAPCLYDSSQSFCPSNEKWQDVVTCAQCHCIEGEVSSCEGTGGGNCNMEQTGSGAMALVDFSQCSKIDGFSSMFNDWDENNFGALDTFESCAHSYTNDANHKAEDCMQILADATVSETDITQDIAFRLYHDPDGFCTCSQNAGHDTPNCNSFMRLNVLIRETLDACNALDEIDCPAWADFSSVCENNMKQQYGTIDFYKKKQCDYIESGCGGTGAFPAFRHLDCGTKNEVSSKSWQFWEAYSVGCDLATDDDALPTKPPTPTPAPPAPEPDVIPDDTGKASGGAGGKVAIGLGCVALLGASAFLYKKRKDGGGGTRSYNSGGSGYSYQPQRDSEDSLFSGMGMRSDSGGFTPPALPMSQMSKYEGNTAQI